MAEKNEKGDKTLEAKVERWCKGTDLITLVCIVALAVVYKDYMLLRQKILDVQSDLNNTRFADTSGLIFNRNPKTGSETMWALLDRLAPLNNFTSYSDSAEVKQMRGSENTYLWRTGERHQYIRMLSIDSETNMSRPFSYVKHLNFLDLTELNYTNPIYANFVRDPVERIISWYYYIRQGWYMVKYDVEKNTTQLHERRTSIKELKTTFEECVLARIPECIYEPGQFVHMSFNGENKGGSHFSQIGFFCGMGPECNIFGSEEALAKAKYNVENHFAVVGVLEQMQISLEVFENYIPAFFRGARKVFKEMKEDQVNKNKVKPKVSTEVRAALRANFTTEIEFYEFCKQRLLKQYLAIL